MLELPTGVNTTDVGEFRDTNVSEFVEFLNGV
jgi:hypothetical protein